MRNIAPKMGNMQKKSFLYTGITMATVLIVGALWLANNKRVAFSTYEDPKTGVSLLYPSSWEVMEDLAPEVGLIVAFRGPRKNEYDTFSPNANVSYIVIRKPLTKAELKQVTMQQMAVLFRGNTKVLQDEPAMVAGNSGFRLVFVGQNVANPNQFLLAWTQIGDRVYVFTYANTAEGFNDYLSVANAMLNSLKVK